MKFLSWSATCAVAILMANPSHAPAAHVSTKISKMSRFVMVLVLRLDLVVAIASSLSTTVATDGKYKKMVQWACCLRVNT